jgi:hypothetical protein
MKYINNFLIVFTVLLIFSCVKNNSSSGIEKLSDDMVKKAFILSLENDGVKNDSLKIEVHGVHQTNTEAIAWLTVSNENNSSTMALNFINLTNGKWVLRKISSTPINKYRVPMRWDDVPEPIVF